MVKFARTARPFRARGAAFDWLAVFEAAGQSSAVRMPGRWIHERARLALVAQPAALEARGYVDTDAVRRIADGDKGRFVDDMHLLAPRQPEVVRVGVAAFGQFDNRWLPSAVSGPFPGRLQEGKPVPKHAVSEVAAFAPEGARMLPVTGIRGEIQIRGTPQVLAFACSGEFRM